MSDLCKCTKCDTKFPAKDIAAHVKKCKGGKGSTALATKPEKHLAEQFDLTLTGGTKGPNWDRARFLLGRIGTALRLSLAGQVLLGHELLTIKTELGFVGAGRPKKLPQDAVIKSQSRTWPEWCKAELRISENGKQSLSHDTADRFIACYVAAKAKLNRNGGEAKLLGLLEMNPSDLTEEDEDALSKMTDKIVEGETQKSLLEELRIAKLHDTSGLGGTKPKPKKLTAAQQAEQLAFAFFSRVPDTVDKIRKGVGNLLTSPDYKGYLYKLPLTATADEDVSLEDLQATLESALNGDLARLLADVKQAIKDKQQAAAA